MVPPRRSKHARQDSRAGGLQRISPPSAPTSVTGGAASSVAGHTSAPTSAEEADARTAGARASAPTSAKRANARSAEGPASVSTSANGTNARTVEARAFVVTSAKVGAASSVGGQASVLTNVKVGDARSANSMLKVLQQVLRAAMQQQQALQQELRASMQQQQAAQVLMQQQHEQHQAAQHEWQASMQLQMQQLQMLMSNQIPILMATQAGLADATVGLQTVAAEVQRMDGRMQKLESNLADMQRCTDDKMRKFGEQQRVTEAQIHGVVASANDMKLQLQAEVALNITRTQKQQEDSRALAALVEQKLQKEAAKLRGNEKCLEKLQHTARETKQQLQAETALNCGRDQAFSARTAELEWSFRREADKLRGNEERLAHLEEHLTLEMRCNAARDAEIQQEVNALRDHVSNLEARLAQGGPTGQLAESNLHAEHERRRTEGAQQQEEARKRDLKRQDSEEELLRDESMKRDIKRQEEEGLRDLQREGEDHVSTLEALQREGEALLRELTLKEEAPQQEKELLRDELGLNSSTTRTMMGIVEVLDPRAVRSSLLHCLPC